MTIANQEVRCIYSGAQVLVNHQWISEHAIVVEGKKIKAIIPEQMIEHHLPAKHHHYSSTCYLIPGLIDLHIHGAHGCDVMDGTQDAILAISKALAAEGITGFLATTMTAEAERIASVLASIASAMQQPQASAILGVHLEGPFISPEKMGAQYGGGSLPALALFDKWQRAANEAIKIVTIAPELTGSIPFIEALHAQGVIVSIGHTNASYEETCRAIAAGGSQATHLFNAMRGILQREPGAAGALLLAEEVTAELIMDGMHLHPAIARLAWKMKGSDRLLLVTDAMRAKCMGDGEYELGGQRVTVKAGKAELPDGTLAGSTLRMPQAIKNMMDFTGCTLAEAVRMASYNPARVLGLTQHKGTIEVGKDADFVVMDASLQIIVTVREGIPIFHR